MLVFGTAQSQGIARAEQEGQGHSRVPKPPKKRLFKAWEAQNAGFGTAQSQGMAGQLGQSRQGRGTAEFQNHQKKRFFKAWQAQNAGFGTAQSRGMAGQSRQGRGTAEFQNQNAFSRPGKLKMLVLELLKARAWQGS